MITFPLHNATLDLRGKPPQELPHGKLAVPPEVRELVARERARFSNGAFAPEEEKTLNRWTVSWYFDGLGHEVMYRETPDGPEVVAVGMEETLALRKALPLEEQRKLEIFLGY